MNNCIGTGSVVCNASLSISALMRSISSFIAISLQAWYVDFAVILDQDTVLAGDRVHIGLKAILADKTAGDAIDDRDAAFIRSGYAPCAIPGSSPGKDIARYGRAQRSCRASWYIRCNCPY